MDVADTKLYAEALRMTSKYSGALQKHMLLVIGCMLYIAFAVMATMFYSPSYFACIGIGGTMWSLMNSVVNALFITMFIFFVCQGLFPDGFMTDLRVALPNILFVCMVYLIASYGILLYRCHDPMHCRAGEGDACTAFNSRIMAEVNKTKRIRDLHAFYKKQMGTLRTSIASCTNYYDASYADEGASGRPCAPSTGSTLCNISEDPAVGAPVLAEFFVMTSGRTCVVGPQYDGYMSTQMIVIALMAGARCLDFDVSAHGHGKNALPIVTTARDRDNLNLQRNFLLFEDCLKTVMRYWFGASSVVGNAKKRDPLFIHLNLRRSLTTKCMDGVAKLLHYYFGEYMGQHLLGDDFHHSATNMGEIPICMLFNRVVVMVNSQHRTASVLLDPLINAYVGVDAPTQHFKEDDWSTVKNATNPRDDYVKYNRKRLTYVPTSFHPYRPISNTLKRGEGGPSSDVFAKYTTRDGMTDLLLNKATINNNPIIAFQYGCQFVAMNFQNLDSDMSLYMSFFKNSSFLIKPAQLRREKLMTVSVPLYGTCAPSSTVLSNTSASTTSCQQLCLSENEAVTFKKDPNNVNWSKGSPCNLSLFTEHELPTTLSFGSNALKISNFSKPILHSSVEFEWKHGNNGDAPCETWCETAADNKYSGGEPSNYSEGATPAERVTPCVAKGGTADGSADWQNADANAKCGWCKCYVR